MLKYTILFFRSAFTLQMIISITLGQSVKTNFAELLPTEIEGWTIQETDQEFGPDSLYEYINGGAELFLSYDFQKMVARIYCAPDQPDIIVDVFDMKTSYNAYGVFSSSREEEDSTFGKGSQYVPGLLLFWMDRYYVSILFNPETDPAKQAAFQIARHMENSIRTIGPLPEILELLPRDSLLKQTIRYFKHYIWLNSYYFISNENILHIQDDVEAVLAKYESGTERLLLLLISYPDSLIAQRAMDEFSAAFLPELSNTPIAQKDNRWFGCQLTQNRLIIVLDASGKEAVREISNAVHSKLNK